MINDFLEWIVVVLERIFLVLFVFLDFDVVDVFVWYVDFEWLEFVVDVLWVDFLFLVGIN